VTCVRRDARRLSVGIRHLTRIVVDGEFQVLNVGSIVVTRRPSKGQVGRQTRSKSLNVAGSVTGTDGTTGLAWGQCPGRNDGRKGNSAGEELTQHVDSRVPQSASLGIPVKTLYHSIPPTPGANLPRALNNRRKRA
jgi:hypothetical protein